MPQTGTRHSKVSFFGLDAGEFDVLVASWGGPRFRAGQIRDWVYRKHVTDPAGMTNLSRRDRDTLAERVAFTTARITSTQRSGDGTIKLLMSWLPDDGTEGKEISAETVMIPDADRRTACVSSQVGCPVGCKFCASGMNGVKGNLTAAQIVEQVVALNSVMRPPTHPLRAGDGDGSFRPNSSAEPRISALEPNGETRIPTIDSSTETSNSTLESGRNDPSPSPARETVIGVRNANRADPAIESPTITNIVFMGMGEPMANYANVLKAIRILHDPQCYNLGARRITVSTVGVPAKMRELAREDLPLNLAISLHAPNEPLRKQLIPWAEHFPLADILDAAREYFDQTGREVTLEYILLAGVNDQPEHARELAKLCKTLRANVNLIRYNEVAGLPFGRPKSEDVVRFQEILRATNVNAHVRKSRGRDIDAACGQLRRKNLEGTQGTSGTSIPLVTLGTPGNG